jgi:hypothetical protein
MQRLWKPARPKYSAQLAYQTLMNKGGRKEWMI